MDFTVIESEEINWTTNASGKVGFGGYLTEPGTNIGRWFQNSYPPWFEELEEQVVRIDFKELYALAVAVKLFSPLLANKRVRILCDNQAVVAMVNNSCSSCRLCMILIRMITLTSLIFNV